MYTLRVYMGQLMRTLKEFLVRVISRYRADAQRSMALPRRRSLRLGYEKLQSGQWQVTRQHGERFSAKDRPLANLSQDQEVSER